MDTVFQRPLCTNFQHLHTSKPPPPTKKKATSSISCCHCHLVDGMMRPFPPPFLFLVQTLEMSSNQRVLTDSGWEKTIMEELASTPKLAK